MNWGFPDFRLREVDLQGCAPGLLYLSHLPGRCGDEGSPQHTWRKDRQVIIDAGITIVVCLLSDQEIEHKSVAYGWAIAAGQLPWRTVRMPISDFSVPQDEAIKGVALEVAHELTLGRRVLVHCSAGIGRTGTCGCAILMALGVPLARAEALIEAAGSRPEVAAQKELLLRLEQTRDENDPARIAMVQRRWRASRLEAAATSVGGTGTGTTVSESDATSVDARCKNRCEDEPAHDDP